MATETLQRVEIPTTAIDPGYAQEFERERSEIYKETKDGPDRRARLTELADLVTLAPDLGAEGEPLSVHMAIQKALAEGALRAEGIRYRITVGGTGNEIKAIDLVKPLPEDKLATARAKYASSRVPWGHKTNRSSFRVHTSRALPKGHRRAA